MMRMGTGFVVVASLLWVGCGGPEKPAEPSIAQGGLLYDAYWKVSSASAPAETHPLWAERPDAESNGRTGADTWRCKECHGWDYRGVDGAYGSGSHRTGFPGVLDVDASEADIVRSLEEEHGYGEAGLRDVDLQSLALFVRRGLVDTTRWIDGQGAFRGDAERGEELFANGLGSDSACASCHGPDGLAPPQGAGEGYDDFVGKIAVENPWEFLHKVRFGQPGTKMPAAALSGASLQDIVDLGAYAQTLPTGK